MPFKKVGTNDYTSPSGRHFNSAQVRLYYANGGKFPGEKTMKYSKGGDVRSMTFAKGGANLGRARDFMKEPDEFRDDQDFQPGQRKKDPEDQEYGKGKKK